MKVTTIDNAYRTFEAAVPGDLAGKEDYLVQVTSAGLIELYTNGVAVGVLHQQLQGDTETWSVRLLGKGGTVRVIQNEAITPGTRVKGLTGGKVVALGASGRSLGVKVYPLGTGAAGDVIEIADVVENVA